VGGWNPTYGDLNVLRVYDPVADTWDTTGTPMPTAREAMATGVIAGKLYVAGGTINNGTQTNVLEVYDPSNDSWATLASMPVNRSHFAAGVIGGKLYLAGGGAGGVYTNELLIYDPAGDSWGYGTPLPGPCNAAAGGVINNKLYVAGGATRGPIEEYMKNWVYDPVTNSWDVTIAPMLPPGRCEVVSGVISDELYVAGGFPPPTDPATNTLFVYNASSDTWATRAPMPAARYRGAAAAVGGKLYLVGGGADGIGLIPEVWVYTPPPSLFNPTCAECGQGDYEFKVEPPTSGTYPLDGFLGGSHTVSIATGDGIYFSWTSDMSIDGVIVKGGPNSSLYTYDPESFGDGGLHAPINPTTGQPYELSHISFCFDYEVKVDKETNTSFTRTYQWDIDKSVSPDEWHLFKGDMGTSQYTITVNRVGHVDSDWAVAGNIIIHNPAPFPANITGIADEVSPDINATVSCDVSFPYELEPLGTLICYYEADLPDASGRTNTATVTTGPTGPDQIVRGNEAKIPFDFSQANITKVNSSVTVTDTNGGSWAFTDSGSKTYDKTFDCATGGGTYTNTAAIVETGQSDDAAVTVNCYGLGVTKDAKTSFTRTYDWTIDKSADQSELTISLGQQFPVNYSVAVDATYGDSDHAVAGTITISNLNPYRDANLTNIADTVSPDITAALDPHDLVVPAGGSLTVNYSIGLPDTSTRTNTATATLQNYDFDHQMTPTPRGTTEFSGTAQVDFTTATVTELDECIDVSDSDAGSLGTVCYGIDSLPKTFSYSRWVGPYELCGSYTVENTASFVTNDTQSTGSDSWIVGVNVPCGAGCTLTQGYWKTHSEYGPAPYDETWAKLPDGADTPFFGSGQSYRDVLWTPPKGNVYYILAHQYIAAELNALNGAYVPPEVNDAMQQAKSLFQDFTPDGMAGLKGKSGKTLRAQVIELAELLDSYNTGLIGPGHCPE
jgi:N-acetylneuraminic acid mutarotase